MIPPENVGARIGSKEGLAMAKFQACFQWRVSFYSQLCFVAIHMGAQSSDQSQW